MSLDIPALTEALRLRRETNDYERTEEDNERLDKLIYGAAQAVVEAPTPDYEAAWLEWKRWNPWWMPRWLTRQLRTPIAWIVEAAFGGSDLIIRRSDV
jgi:hypothetical protein